MIRLIATMTSVAGMVLGGAAVAVAGTTTIPRGFLLTEAEARTPPLPEFADEEWWKIIDGTSRQLELNPCRRTAKPRDGRSAMRTITHLTSGPGYSSEQLVLYRSAKSAHAAYRTLQADLKRCHRGSAYVYVLKPSSIGDEAMSVAGYFTKARKREAAEIWFVGRRGTALFLYNDDVSAGAKLLAGQGKKMAKKVCGLPGVCVKK
ncbi:hypothetical protein [Microbispora sp. NPDC049125]|uniref:hypothetical protein n=1 Tax=Microbispora sp. NPDC049125 TaxID=3154929 RepID=UPI00346616B3